MYKTDDLNLISKTHVKKNKLNVTKWWERMPVIPELGRQTQADLSELEASLN